MIKNLVRRSAIECSQKPRFKKRPSTTSLGLSSTFRSILMVLELMQDENQTCPNPHRKLKKRRKSVAAIATTQPQKPMHDDMPNDVHQHGLSPKHCLDESHETPLDKPTYTVEEQDRDPCSELARLKLDLDDSAEYIVNLNVRIAELEAALEQRDRTIQSLQAHLAAEPTNHPEVCLAEPSESACAATLHAIASAEAAVLSPSVHSPSTPDSEVIVQLRASVTPTERAPPPSAELKSTQPAACRHVTTEEEYDAVASLQQLFSMEAALPSRPAEAHAEAAPVATPTVADSSVKSSIEPSPELADAPPSEEVPECHLVAPVSPPPAAAPPPLSEVSLLDAPPPPPESLDDRPTHLPEPSSDELSSLAPSPKVSAPETPQADESPSSDMLSQRVILPVSSPLPPPETPLPEAATLDPPDLEQLPPTTTSEAGETQPRRRSGRSSELDLLQREAQRFSGSEPRSSRRGSIPAGAKHMEALASTSARPFLASFKEEQATLPCAAPAGPVALTLTVDAMRINCIVKPVHQCLVALECNSAVAAATDSGLDSSVAPSRECDATASECDAATAAAAPQCTPIDADALAEIHAVHELLCFATTRAHGSPLADGEEPWQQHLDGLCRLLVQADQAARASAAKQPIKSGRRVCFTSHDLSATSPPRVHKAGSERVQEGLINDLAALVGVQRDWLRGEQSPALAAAKLCKVLLELASHSSLVPRLRSAARFYATELGVLSNGDPLLCRRMCELVSSSMRFHLASIFAEEEDVEDELLRAILTRVRKHAAAHGFSLGGGPDCDENFSCHVTQALLIVHKAAPLLTEGSAVRSALKLATERGDEAGLIELSPEHKGMLLEWTQAHTILLQVFGVHEQVEQLRTVRDNSYHFGRLAHYASLVSQLSLADEAYLEPLGDLRALQARLHEQAAMARVARETLIVYGARATRKSSRGRSSLGTR